MNEPAFVNRDRMVANKDYVAWLSDVKTRFRTAQTKAMVRVNTAMLEFYWSIGRDLTEMHPEENWGKGIVKQFALDMRNEFPEESGFSWSNVKDMKRWYLFYFEHIGKSQQPAGFSENDGVDKKSQQPVGFLEMPESFGLVPWGHHIHIVSKSNSLDEALFYINKTIVEWSLKDIDKPLGVAAYQLREVVERTVNELELQKKNELRNEN